MVHGMYSAHPSPHLVLSHNSEDGRTEISGEIRTGNIETDRGKPSAIEPSRGPQLGKRVFDLVLAFSALCVLAPVFGVLALLLRAKLGAPIIFRQERPGLGGRPFMICKFRTMTDARDAAGMLLPDLERLTRFGKFLRSTSLDELPELWNVLAGDMSLVGPRPLLMDYLLLYSPEQSRRHEALPGITGLAQVKGRNLLSWEEKFALDVWYVDHQSLALDARILLATLGAVLRREGINAPNHSSAPRFVGRAASSEPVTIESVPHER
jgi:lipopolysaccharide/colanic/teichoic acid biosynthesis glycosyltransferase